ncbi:MAG TPA: cyclic nucleotide-binding domain-containing protein, partial [Gemmatimonadaceae bacterium]
MTSNVAFPSLTERQIETLSKYAKRRHFQHNDTLFQAGVSPATFFVVLSGAVEILDHSGDEPRTIVVHEPGQFTGDIDILTRRITVVSAVARGETDVLEVAPADIRRLIAED